MNHPKPHIRLYIPGEYAPGHMLAPSPNQAHYLAQVMRLREGDSIAVFNGSDGQWLAEIAQVTKKSVMLALKNRQMAQIYSPDLWLAFAPIKNKTELVVEKATELGVSKILPVFMKHNVVTKVNKEKLEAHAIEAAEQCERHDVPVIEEHKNLAALIASWPKDRLLFFGDESGGGQPLGETLQPMLWGKYGIVIGPEGGFSSDERQILRQPFVKPFSMGPRILRADTAAVAALACIMMQLGDWDRKPHFVRNEASC